MANCGRVVGRTETIHSWQIALLRDIPESADGGGNGLQSLRLKCVGRTRTAELLKHTLLDPGSLPPEAGAGGRHRGGEGLTAAPISYTAATVKLRGGRSLRGALRSETTFDIQLMALDGHLFLLGP